MCASIDDTFGQQATTFSTANIYAHILKACPSNWSKYINFSVPEKADRSYNMGSGLCSSWGWVVCFLYSTTLITQVLSQLCTHRWGPILNNILGISILLSFLFCPYLVPPVIISCVWSFRHTLQFHQPELLFSSPNEKMKQQFCTKTTMASQGMLRVPLGTERSHSTLMLNMSFTSLTLRNCTIKYYEIININNSHIVYPQMHASLQVKLKCLS